MTPSTLASAFKSLTISSIAHLPPEVLFNVFAQLEEPVDLYKVSLVSQAWRSIATDDQLWEDHYLRCYKPLTPTKNTGDDERAIYHHREAKRRAGMIAWLKQTATSPPSTELFEAFSDRALQGMLRAHRVQKMDKPADVSDKVWSEVWKLAHKDLDTSTTPPEAVPPGPLQLTPPFLEKNSSMSLSEASLPKFRLLFAKRMNVDEAIMQELRSLVDLTSCTLDGLLRLVVKHGDVCRPLLAALCATETLTHFNLERFLPHHDADEAPWPRARETYATVAKYKMEPARSHCLALQHIAAKGLGHLQRREGVMARKFLLDRQDDAEAGDLKEKVLKSSKSIEQAMACVGLFRSGEGSDIREYLDLLALFVFADLQAEDNAAAREEKPYGLAPDPESMPAGSTRHHLARVVSSLRRLRYGVADGPDSTDIDNAFINVVMYCPAQRLATPLTLASIVSAVARRLGIAASVSNATTSRPLIVAVEEGEEPATWKGEWERFFVDAADVHQGRIFDKNVDFICETEVVKSRLLEQGAEHDSLEHLLGPASPLSFLERVASDIMRLVKAKKTSISRDSGKEQYKGQDDFIGESGVRHQLGHLRLFLEARVGLPPDPLLLPTPPSSIASLDEPPHVHSRRMGPVRLFEDAEYCAEWIRRIVAEQRTDKATRDEAVAKASILLARRMGTATISGLYGCDSRLLFELDKALKARDDAEGRSDAAATESHIFQPSNFFKIFLIELLQEDAQTGKGLGCSGAADEEWRKAGPPTTFPRHLIDRAANPEVKYGIGTVFKHRTERWLGVVVGWDTECRADDEWIESTGKARAKR